MSDSALTYLDLPVASTGRDPQHSHDSFTTDRRRWLQLGLATVWIIAGVLQSQPFMFTRSFATEVLLPTAHGNPAWLSGSIIWAAKIVESSPIWTNSVFAAIQLLLGLGIASRRFLRPALAASIVWSLLVWWFGEGLGGLFAPGASALGGAPGAVILYAVLAVLLWPTSASTGRSFVASRPVGLFAAKAVWLVLWGGMAVLNLQPANLDDQSVSRLVNGIGSGQPRWLGALANGFVGVAAHNGVLLSVIGTVALAFVAVGVVLPPPALRVAVVVALVISAFIWVFGEGLGMVFGGQGTDVDSGPLLTLIGLAYWPSRVKPVDKPTESSDQEREVA